MDIDWYYINLASRPDRDKHACAEFAKVGIHATRFNAYTPDEWQGSSSTVQRMRDRTPGAIGCYQSQMELIDQAYRSGKVTAVCEDDVCFCNDLQLRLDYIERAVANLDWDIFYLGATFHVPGQWYHNKDCSDWGGTGKIGVDVSPTSNPRILRTYGIWGTYAYLVNPVNAAGVHGLFRKNIHRADGIDHLAIILGPAIRSYCFVPGCAWQYDNESNIGNGVTRFSGFKKLGPYVWADQMSEFNPEKYCWKTGKVV